MPAPAHLLPILDRLGDGAPVLVTCISPECAWTGTDEDLALPAPSPRRTA